MAGSVTAGARTQGRTADFAGHGVATMAAGAAASHPVLFVLNHSARCSPVPSLLTASIQR